MPQRPRGTLLAERRAELALNLKAKLHATERALDNRGDRGR